MTEPRTGATAAAVSPATAVSPAYRHFVLGLSTLAAVGSSVVHMGTPFLIPALTATGLPLPAAGLITAMPAAGIVFTLIAWGWFVDVFGERAALSLGLGSTAVLTGAAAWASASGPVVLAGALFLAGCAAASVNSASGRVVSGWYPPSQRGTAMGIRQMAQPLGAALAAVTLPVLAANYGIRAALGFAAVLCAVLALACLLGIKDPPRPEVGSADHAAAKVSPYRGSRYLVRIHIASAMLSWPQSMMGSFILVWLIARGHSEVSAGVIVMIAQLSGAGSRAAMGFISDRARSRLRPYRHVATVTLVLSGAMALIDGFGAGWTAGTAGVGGVAGVAGVAGLGDGSFATSPLGIAATIVIGALAVAAVSPNGLAFTAVAEYAGPLWSGRALGTQNTFQNIIYASTPPLAGAVVATVGFPAMFALTAVFPAVALAVGPRDDERRHTELNV
ncbi:MFS transporter [uncultured Corynebacterium sp.]|uniref:MFS transporter n=1 Tax=uncultured Corynebacterium sp. TaxID=159447 RepID=UPI00261D80F4|nr:MFS transporter [uncultured Corynebacterium sp.]